MEKPTCIAFDFDRTLGNTQDSEDGFFEVIGEKGVSAEDIEYIKKDFQEVRFNRYDFIEALSKRAGCTLDNRAIIDEWLENHYFAYDGALEFINAHKNRIPIHIITFGDEYTQKKKIEVAGMDSVEAHITGAVGAKGVVLRQLLHTYGAPVLFVDDKPGELDAVQDEYSHREVITAFFDRPNPYGVTHEMQKHHVRLKSFQDIEKMLQNR